MGESKVFERSTNGSLTDLAISGGDSHMTVHQVGLFTLLPSSLGFSEVTDPLLGHSSTFPSLSSITSPFPYSASDSCKVYEKLFFVLG